MKQDFLGLPPIFWLITLLMLLVIWQGGFYHPTKQDHPTKQEIVCEEGYWAERRFGEDKYLFTNNENEARIKAGSLRIYISSYCKWEEL